MNNEKIEFKNSKVKDRSDLFINDERIGDVASNLVPVIQGCFDIYKTMTAFVEKNYGKEELGKNYTPEELAALVESDYEKAVNIILFQVGKKAFLGFKGILQETSPIAKLKGATGILNNVKMLLAKLGPDSAPTNLTDNNRANAKMFAENFQIITDVLNNTAETVVFLFRGFVVDQCDYAAGVTDAFNNAVGNKTVNILNYPPKTHSIRDLQGRNSELQEELEMLEALREAVKMPDYKGRFEAETLLNRFDKVYLHNDHKNEITSLYNAFLKLYPEKKQTNIMPKKGEPKKRGKDDVKNTEFDKFYNAIDKHLDARIDEMKHAIDLNNKNLKSAKRNPLRWIQYLFTSDRLTKRIFGKKFAQTATSATEVSGTAEEVTGEANTKRAFSFKSPLLKKRKAVADESKTSSVDLNK